MFMETGPLLLRVWVGEGVGGWLAVGGEWVRVGVCVGQSEGRVFLFRSSCESEI